MSGYPRCSNYWKLIPRVFQFFGIAISCSVRKKMAKTPMCFAKSTSAVSHRILNLQCLTLLMRQRLGYARRDRDAAMPDKIVRSSTPYDEIVLNRQCMCPPRDNRSSSQNFTDYSERYIISKIP